MEVQSEVTQPKRLQEVIQKRQDLSGLKQRVRCTQGTEQHGAEPIAVTWGRGGFGTFFPVFPALEGEVGKLSSTHQRN